MPTVWRWVGQCQAALVAECFRGGVHTLAITPAPPMKPGVPGGLGRPPPSRCPETQKPKCLPSMPAMTFERGRGKLNISEHLLHTKNHV